MAAIAEDVSIQRAEAGYRPSWIDRLVGWVDRLPIPAWLFYLLSTLALAVLITVVLWIDGSVPVGAYGSMQGIFPPFVFYFLALYHYLTRVGSRSLEAFRPLMEVDESEFARIEYELATLPRGLGWLSIGIAVATEPNFFLSGQAFGDHPPNTALPYFVAALSAAFFGATIFCLIVRSFRQLRMVHRLHARATNINLLKLEPAHAFSGLTARTGIGLILLLVLGYLYTSPRFYSDWLVGAYLLLGSPAIVIFVVPVLGMRDRLIEEKKRVLHATSDLLQSTTEKLENKIRVGDFSELQGMETAIKALIRRREMLEKISTWPWDSVTVRSFASTLLLPVFLWLVTRLLGRFV